jgi:hypothetical protein
MSHLPLGAAGPAREPPGRPRSFAQPQRPSCAVTGSAHSSRGIGPPGPDTSRTELMWCPCSSTVNPSGLGLPRSRGPAAARLFVDHDVLAAVRVGHRDCCFGLLRSSHPRQFCQRWPNNKKPATVGSMTPHHGANEPRHDSQKRRSRLTAFSARSLCRQRSRYCPSGRAQPT